MRFPSVESQRLIRFLMAKGFRVVGQSGSRVQFQDDRGTAVTVHVHPGRKIARRLLRKIIRDMAISREEFDQLLGTA